MPPQPTATQLRKGVLELAILTLLAEEESYGAELVDRLSHHPGLAAPAGTVYPLLTRLTRAKALTTRWQESPVGPPRKYYSLTREGHELRTTLTEDWRLLVDAMTTLLPDPA
ncbi:PadR family transcriptional regulator [Corynebacterium halotolerans]|uniref:Transcriptional regulator, PadR family protein n=1 Tax=Corynebacterium halotolerans YIM 70093 = DSM 44683 TaxID=1121362 RepID=M1NNY6_9CORY|nr:PadR family transcriptional regulator [Corynebacterium halotolerans]AGF71217.1 transcriptional regulator, PadR family protein [Corynebacterium halotolerans YIM 70093 = DSM 44683]